MRWLHLWQAIQVLDIMLAMEVNTEYIYLENTFADQQNRKGLDKDSHHDSQFMARSSLLHWWMY
jgi:hypothetical protein